MPSRIDRELCKRIIRENIETLCRHFFPNGKKVGEEWQLGSLRGEAGRTLNIHLGNDKAGVFQDFNTGEHGDFVAAIKLSRNLGFVDAALEIGKAVGINLENPVTARTRGARYTTGKSTKVCNWDLDYVLSDSDIKELATWRGYSIEFCKWAAQRKVIGRRSGLWAFPVCDTERLFRRMSAGTRISGFISQDSEISVRNWFRW